MVDQSFSIEGHFHPHRQDYIAGHAYMPNFMLLATAWGPKHGGINAFNMDFAIGLSSYLGSKGKIFCAAFSPPEEDVANARNSRVRLVRVDRPVDSHAYDKSWALDVWNKFKKEYPDERVDWWIGHDVTTGWAAVEGPAIARHGKSALIMHMNYADYQAYKGGVGNRAAEKEQAQRQLFSLSDRCFANGPLLRDALKEIVSDVSMLIPGFADVPVKPASHRLKLITFGRMDRESDRIKQGALAVAGFASAVQQAWSNPGSPEKLRKAPQMRVIGIKEPGGNEEQTLKSLATQKAGREVNLIALPFDENREQLFAELGRANISLMLSWHEGFGLTGWEAVAGEVPLIIGRNTRLRQLLEETFGDQLTGGYVRTIDVRGQQGDDDTANFRVEDEDDVREAIMECAADYETARATAARLKRDLQQKLVCTWENTAKQFCEVLGIEPLQGSGETTLDSQVQLPPTPLSDFISIPTLSWPGELSKKGFEPPDSMLLRPESRVVRFHSFREPLRDTIVDWVINLDEPIKLRLQAGEGGVGKTRLMIEVCDQLERLHGWRAGFVDRSQATAGGFLALLNEGKPCLVVLDYAESRTNEIIELTGVALRAPRTPYVRFMLLARDGRDWWDRLADAAGSDHAVAAVLRGINTKTGPFRMEREHVERDDRGVIFNEALRDFGAVRKKGLASISSPDLSDELFGNPLFIHLAALAALRGQTSLGDKELLGTTLGHERSYWRQILDDAGLTERMLPAFEQAVALFTLCNGKRTAKEAKEILARTPRCKELDPGTRLQIFDAIRRLYPLDGGIAGLQPDLLGETLVSEALATDDELLDAAFDQESGRDDVRYALTVLTRLGRRVHSEQRWLKRALEQNLTRISEDAMSVGTETGSPMAELLSQVIREAEPQERRHAVDMLRVKLPTESFNLSELIVEVKRQVIAFIEKKNTGKSAKRHIALFGAFYSFSLVLRGAGLFAEAADAAAEAVRHASVVFHSDKEDDLQKLANALSNLSNQLGTVGRFDEALQSVVRAEGIMSALAKRGHGKFDGNWATSLQILGGALGDVGRYEEAIAPAEKSEAISRGLAEKRPDAFTAHWATSLSSLSGILNGAGRFEEALEKTERAEVIWRGLAEKQPDAFTADWARSLSNLSVGLRRSNLIDDALEKAAKAEALMHGLAEKRPDAFTADWARSLSNLADAQLAAKTFPVALNTAKEAILRISPFADQYPIAHKPVIGFACRIAAESYFHMEKFDEAVAEARRSAGIWTEIARKRQNYEANQVAKTFLALMKCEIALSQKEAAFVTLGRAFDLLRKPLNDNPRPLNSTMWEAVTLALDVDADAVARVVPSDLLDIVKANVNRPGGG